MFFKNLDSKYRDAFQLNGLVRLGTLEYYRTIGGVREDVLEGSKTITIEPKEDLRFEPGEINGLLPGNIRIKGGLVRFVPGSSGSFGSSYDAYIFSVSETQNPSFGDAAYQIHDPVLFKEMLHSELMKVDVAVFASHFAKVVYGGQKDFQLRFAREEFAAEQFNSMKLEDFFLKPNDYKHELEWRFAFFTSRAIEKPYYDITCDLATVHACCTF